jgi:hypothetical protein
MEIDGHQLRTGADQGASASLIDHRLVEHWKLPTVTVHLHSILMFQPSRALTKQSRCGDDSFDWSFEVSKLHQPGVIFGRDLMKRCNIYLSDLPATFPDERPGGIISYGPPVTKPEVIFEPTANDLLRTDAFRKHQGIQQLLLANQDIPKTARCPHPDAIIQLKLKDPNFVNSTRSQTHYTMWYLPMVTRRSNHVFANGLPS